MMYHVVRGGLEQKHYTHPNKIHRTEQATRQTEANNQTTDTQRAYNYNRIHNRE